MSCCGSLKSPIRDCGLGARPNLIFRAAIHCFLGLNKLTTPNSWSMWVMIEAIILPSMGFSRSKPSWFRMDVYVWQLAQYVNYCCPKVLNVDGEELAFVLGQRTSCNCDAGRQFGTVGDIGHTYLTSRWRFSWMSWLIAARIWDTTPIGTCVSLWLRIPVLLGLSRVDLVSSIFQYLAQATATRIFNADDC